MSFADLKRKSQSNFDFLQKELTKSSNEGGADERIWKAKLDPSAMVMLFFASSLLPMESLSHGQKFGVMLSKVLVVG